MRHILKANSSRVVYYSSTVEKKRLWIQKGIIANYNELRYHMDALNSSTKDFMENVYKQGFIKNALSVPHYLFSKRYNLFNNFNINRTMIFDEKIGISKTQLVKEMKDIGVAVSSKSSYYALTRNYLIKVKIGH